MFSGNNFLLEGLSENWIRVDTTFFVGPTRVWLQPGTLSAYLANYRIAVGVTVTVSIDTATYAYTLPWLGHIDGHRIVVTNSGMNGGALVGADFAALDAIWDIDSVTGITPASVATAKAAAAVIVRAKYRVIFELADGIGIAAGNYHAGDWSDAPCLWINTGTATVGATTGNGIDTGIGDGPGGVVIVPQSCFFGFTNAGWLCDYGGVINADEGLALFSTDECARTDFGGVIYANDCILIGGDAYGYRANHGGSAWIDGCYVRGCNNGTQIDNSPGMARIHGCDIQFNYEGVVAQYGGSLKAAFGARNLGTTLTASGNGATATVTFDAPNTVPVGRSISIIGIVPSGYAGINVVTGSGPGSVSFASAQTGAMSVAGTLYRILPAEIKNNARAQVTLNNGGDFDGRSIDMVSTELFPNNGSAPEVPVYGLNVLIGGTAKLDNAASGTVSGHDKDLYMEGGTVSASGVTFTVAEGPSGTGLSPDGAGTYSVYWPRYRGPQTKSASFSLELYEKSIVNNTAGTCTMTLPSGATCEGREVFVSNTTAQLLISASANIIPRAGGAAGTAILPATSGAWATLVALQAGTWRIMASS